MLQVPANSTNKLLQFYIFKNVNKYPGVWFLASFHWKDIYKQLNDF